MGRLAVKTNLYPLLEYRHGQLISSSCQKGSPADIDNYLTRQGRFRQLEQKDREEINNLIKKNSAKYRL